MGLGVRIYPGVEPHDYKMGKRLVVSCGTPDVRLSADSGTVRLAAPSSPLPLLQPLDDLIAHTMHSRGKVCVGGLCATVAYDDIVIGEWVGIRSPS